MEPIICNFEVQNQGEFDSGDMSVAFQALWDNPEEEDLKAVGTIGHMECLDTDSPTGFTSIGGIGECVWDSPTYENQRKYVSFVFEEDLWDSTEPLLTQCENPETAEERECDNIVEGEYTTYKYSGQTVKVFANITFNYHVNVSIPFEIINYQKYMDSAMAGDPIVMTNVTSSYTGGPVMATVFIPYQPARTGQNQLVVASVYNNGNGVVESIENFLVEINGKYIAETQGVRVIASTFKTIDTYLGRTRTEGCFFYVNGEQRSNVDSGDGYVPRSDDGNYYIICRNDYGTVLEKGEHRRVSFYVKPSDTENTEGYVQDIKSTIITGKVSYYYTNYVEESLTLVNAPPQ